MKKVIYIIGLALLSLVMILALSIKKVSAATIESVEYEDTFDSSDGILNENWINNNAGISTDYNALRILNDNYEWGSHIVLNGYKMTKSCKVEFAVRLLNNEGQWVGFSYGTKNPSYDFPYASGAIIMYPSSSLCDLFVSQSGALNDKDSYKYPLNVFDNALTNINKVVFEFTKEGENLYDIHGYVYDYETDKLKSDCDFGVETIADGYFGFNTCKTSLDIFEFNVYENDEIVYEDDFSNSSIKYTTSGSSSSTWQATNFFSPNNLILGRISKLDLSKNNSSVTYKNEIKENLNKDIDVVYSLEMDLFLNEMTYSGSTGFEIGKKKVDENGFYIGIKRNTLGYSLYLTDEELITTYKLDELNNVTNFKIIVYNNNNFGCYIDNELIYSDNYSGINHGFFSIISKCDSESKGCYIDNFIFVKNSYLEVLSPDYETSFDDTTSTLFNGYEYKSFYTPSSIYYMGLGISTPIYSDAFKNNGYLNITDAGEFTSFGSKAKYKDFIMRFDVTFTNINDWAQVGIEVGKDVISDSATNSKFVAFESTKDGVSYISNKCVSKENLNRGSINGISASFIENATYNFMFVVYNNTIQMFYKEKNEDLSLLSTLRMEFNNVDTYGYETAFFNGFNGYLENFSIENIDFDYSTNNYNGDDETLRTIRYDFSKINELKAFNANSYILSNNIIYISDDYFETKGKTESNITRLFIDEINGAISYKHSNIQVSLNEYNNVISLYNNGSLIDNIYLYEANYCNSILEIEELNKLIIIRFKDGERGDSELYSCEHRYVLDNDNSINSKIVIEVEGSLLLKKLSIFNLDNNITYTKKEYTKTSNRKVKESIQEKDNITDYNEYEYEIVTDSATFDSLVKGCNSSITSNILIVAFIVIMLLVLVIRKGNLNKMKKFNIINLMLIFILTFVLSSCEQTKKQKIEYEFNYDYMFGMCDPSGDLGGGVDEGITNEWLKDICEVSGAKSFRIWVSLGGLFLVNSDNELIFNETYKEKTHDYVNKLVEGGIENILFLPTSYVYPYGTDYSGYDVPDPNENGEDYQGFLNIMAKAYEMLAREFPDINNFETGNEPDLNGSGMHKKGYVYGANASANSEYIYSSDELGEIIADMSYYCRKAIKSVNEKNKLALPGLSLYYEPEFIENIYLAIESKKLPFGYEYSDVDSDNYFDIIDWHPYAYAGNIGSALELKVTDEMWDEWMDTIFMIHDICVKHGDSEKPVYFSEFGYTDVGKEEYQDTIALNMVKALELIKENMPWVEAVFCFRGTTLVSQKASDIGTEENFGMFYNKDDIENAGIAKPVAKIAIEFFNTGSKLPHYKDYEYLRNKYKHN